MPLDWLPGEALGYLFVLFIVGVLLALAFGHARRGGSPSAEEILKRRYATGELDRRQYEEQLEEIRR